MASFSSTIAELNQALSRMPTTRTTVISMTMRKAGTLNTSGMPSRWGAAASAWAAWVTAAPRAATAEAPPWALSLGDLLGGLGGRAVVDAHPAGQVDPHVVEQLLEVAGPGDGHRHVAHRVLDDEVPADDPADQLAEGGVGVGVGRAGDRHHGGELGVAERREAAGDGGEDEGEGDRGARARVPAAPRRGGAHGREDAGADDGADAQQGELEGAQGPPQLRLGVLGGGQDRVQRLGAEDALQQRFPPRGPRAVRPAYLPRIHGCMNAPRESDTGGGRGATEGRICVPRAFSSSIRPASWPGRRNCRSTPTPCPPACPAAPGPASPVRGAGRA